MGYTPLSVDMSLEKQLLNASAAGKQFYVSTAQYQISAGGAYAGISVFFAARATKIVLVSARGWNATSGGLLRLAKTTTDPNYSGKTISGPAITNSLGSGGAATSGGTLTSATEAISSSTGTLHRTTRGSTNAGMNPSELLQKLADCLIIPPNVAGGFVLIISGSANDVVFQELVWCEL